MSNLLLSLHTKREHQIDKQPYDLGELICSDKSDRRIEICSPRKIEAWLRFDFPGRERAGMPYSQMRWHGDHFNGADWDHRGRKKAIYKLISDPSTHPLPETKTPPSPLTARLPRWTPWRNRRRSSASSGMRDQIQRPIIQPAKRPGKGWAEDVDTEHGNNDFLMLANVYYTHPEVRQDVLNWGAWMIDHIGVDGFRLDAVRHISFNFIRDWIKHVGAASRRKTRKDPLIIGEIWTGELRRILKWLDAVQDPSGHPQVYAFDAPLLYRFSHLSEDIVDQVRRRSISNTLPQAIPDLRSLLEDTLLAKRPKAALTLVTNHDTQPGQESATPMNRKLKPLFYAFILLRQDGLPSVFWGDAFGIRKPDRREPPVGVADGVSHPSTSLLVDLVMCRKLFAYGKQTDYWDSPSCIGWTRSGDGHRSGCVVVLSIQRPNAPRHGSDKQRPQYSRMKIGNPGEVWFDILRHIESEISIDARGFGTFPVNGPGVSVFVKKNTPGTEMFPVQFDIDIYRDLE